jgi:hypothetical protein
MFDLSDRVFGMRIFPLSESILLPLAPTIAGTIANYLRLLATEYYINRPQPGDIPAIGADTVAKTPLMPAEKIYQSTSDSPASDSSINLWMELPIKRVPTSQYQYVSPIAHRLAAKLQLTPLEICQNLPSPIQAGVVGNLDGLEMDVWYDESGYIYFQLDPRSIVTWLNYLHDLPREALPQPISLPESIVDREFDPSSLSVAIYAHARCCSVLALASTEQLISLSATWQLANPDWLVCDFPAQPISDLSHAKNRLTPHPTLIFEHSVEEGLIHALMDVVDGVWSVRGEAGVKTAKFHRFALDLARCWLEFHRHCQIFGTAKRQNPRLAIARCGLTALCRDFLQVLLKDYLKVTAPTEL